MDVIADAPSLPHQIKFVNSEAKHPALVGGYGCGKTEAGIRRTMKLKTFPTHKMGIYAPTYALLRDIWHPKFEEFLSNYRIPYKLNKSENILYMQGFGMVYFRSMDKPESIIGYDHHDSLADEIDVMKRDKASGSWDKIIARNRAKRPDNEYNTSGIMTTPEG
ncbi:MAG: terminase large subunit domain-containing protein, partial [Candidatus Hodarchaeales archaeon]